jgi:glycosyltransferase involved in cell wall biosynthesis
MKPPIALITHAFLNPKDPRRLNIGGVETWMMEFVRLLVDLGFVPVIYQTAENDFTTTLEGAEIIGLGTLDRRRMNQLSHQDLDRRNIRWIIYTSSFVGEKYFRRDNLFIQHGIHWDYGTSGRNPLRRLKWEYIRWMLSRQDLSLCRKSRLTIAVDTNFLNYARIMLGHSFDPGRICYIPNFAVPQSPSNWQSKWRHPEDINIVFSRRFESRRGVTLFAEALEEVLSTSPRIRVTFAGSGSYERYLLEKFRDSSRVKIEEVPHDKIYDLLNRSHIAVIPSTYSEGTSFACLEGMASGCAVVATDVGGLCNIVLPDFSGLLVRPIASEIAFALTSIVSNLPWAESLARRGYDTICHSFSLSLWRKRLQQALSAAGVLEEKSSHEVSQCRC